MDGINRTLYIPLYGKAKVSKMGIILNDKSAEEIWEYCIVATHLTVLLYVNSYNRYGGLRYF